MVASATTLTTENTKTMGFIDHKSRLILVAKIDQFGDGSHIAFHREDAIGDDKFGSFDRAFLEDPFEIFDVVVAVFVGGSEGDLFAFHDGGMVTFVIEKEIVTTRYAGDDT